MGISTEFYSDKIDINFIDVNAKSLWPFSTFVNQVLKFYSHFACSERLRKFPIKYGDLYICGRGVRKLPVQYWHRNHCCICLCVTISTCCSTTAQGSFTSFSIVFIFIWSGTTWNAEGQLGSYAYILKPVGVILYIHISQKQLILLIVKIDSFKKIDRIKSTIHTCVISTACYMI